jgi:hypothetical protein
LPGAPPPPPLEEPELELEELLEDELLLELDDELLELLELDEELELLEEEDELELDEDEEPESWTTALLLETEPAAFETTTE